MSVFKNISALVISACSIFTSVYATEMYWPEVEYDTSIPRHVDVFDYAAGEKITTHADMLKYFDALLKAAPDNIKKVSYAHSWEGRKLIYLVIGSAENIAKLDEF